MATPETTAPPGSFEDLDAAEEHYRDRLRTQRENGDRAGEAESLDNLGFVAQSRGDLEGAAEYHRRSLEISRELDDRAGEAGSLGNLGLVARSRDDLESAEAYFQQALEIQREIGDREGEARTLGNLGMVYFSRDDLPAARGHLERGARQLLELGASHEASKLIRTLVTVCERLDHPDEAVEWCETGMRITSQTGNKSLQRELSVLYAQLSGRNVADSTTELYYHALGHLVRGHGGAAALFEEVWTRRSRLDETTDVYPIAISAGVYLAALRSMTHESPDGEVPDPDEILSEIGADYHRLPDAVTALYRRLTGRETDLTPEQLRERAAGSGESESDELALEGMERRSVARLLDHL